MALARGTDPSMRLKWVPEHERLSGQGSFFSNRVWVLLFCSVVFFFFFPISLPYSLQMKNKERLAVVVRYSLQAFQNWI